MWKLWKENPQTAIEVAVKPKSEAALEPPLDPDPDLPACCVCMEIYKAEFIRGDDEDNRPAILTCGHDCCMSCIPHIFKEGRGECPICRSSLNSEPKLNVLVCDFVKMKIIKIPPNPNDLQRLQSEYDARLQAMLQQQEARRREQEARQQAMLQEQQAERLKLVRQHEMDKIALQGEYNKQKSESENILDATFTLVDRANDSEAAIKEELRMTRAETRKTIERIKDDAEEKIEKMRNDSMYWKAACGGLEFTVKDMARKIMTPRYSSTADDTLRVTDALAIIRARLDVVPNNATSAEDYSAICKYINELYIENCSFDEEDETPLDKLSKIKQKVKENGKRKINREEKRTYDLEAFFDAVWREICDDHQEKSLKPEIGFNRLHLWDETIVKLFGTSMIGTGDLMKIVLDKINPVTMILLYEDDSKNSIYACEILAELLGVNVGAAIKFIDIPKGLMKHRIRVPTTI